MPTVLVPTAYRGPTQGESEIPVEGDSVLACLEAVEGKYPFFLRQVVENGEVHRFVKIFLNEEQLDAKRALATAVSADDRVEVLASIAGG